MMMIAFINIKQVVAYLHKLLFCSGYSHRTPHHARHNHSLSDKDQLKQLKCRTNAASRMGFTGVWDPGLKRGLGSRAKREVGFSFQLGLLKVEAVEVPETYVGNTGYSVESS